MTEQDMEIQVLRRENKRLIQERNELREELNAALELNDKLRDDRDKLIHKIIDGGMCE